MKQLNAKLNLDVIDVSGGCQQRPLDAETVQRYTELMKDGIDFPAIEIIFDGTNHFLWDGFHRYKCYQDLGRKAILCNIEKGNQKQAQWLSFGANKHGLGRPKGAIQFIIEQILRDKKWSEKTSAEIAHHVGCTKRYVFEIKAALGKPEEPPKESENKKETTGGGMNQFIPRKTDTEPETEPKTQICDETGNEIPSKLIDRWMSRAQIQQRIRELDGIRHSVNNSINAREMTYVLLNQTGFDADLINLRNRLLGAIPYAICTYCKGKGCGACHNAGFLNEQSYHAAPKQDKEK